MSKYCFMGVGEESNSMSPQFNIKEMKEDKIDGIIIKFGYWEAITIFGGGYSAINTYLSEMITDTDIEMYVYNREILDEIEKFLLENDKFLDGYFLENRLNIDTEMFIIRGLNNIRKMKEDKDKEIGVILETVFIY